MIISIVALRDAYLHAGQLVWQGSKVVKPIRIVVTLKTCSNTYLVLSCSSCSESANDDCADSSQSRGHRLRTRHT